MKTSYIFQVSGGLRTVERHSIASLSAPTAGPWIAFMEVDGWIAFVEVDGVFKPVARDG